MKIKDAVELAKDKIHGKTYGKEVVGFCPFCHSDKKKFYINSETGQYSCKRGSCGASGNLITLFKELGINENIEYDSEHTPKKEIKSSIVFNEDTIRHIDESDLNIIEYMMSRGVSFETLRDSNVMIKKGRDFMSFVTKVSGKIVSVLYRSTDKKFYMERNSEQRIWGLDTFESSDDTIYITEGHMDCLVLREMGIKNSVSMPNGCMSHEWIDRDWDFLNKFSRIVLCYDNDEPGQNGLQEVRGRLDFASLFHLEYGDYKDINDMFMGDCEGLYRTVRNPVQISMEGFVSLQNVKTSEGVTEKLYSTGLKQFDRIFGGVSLNQSTIICSESGAGKAQPLYSKISTPYGWKRMGDIKVGDIVNGFNKTTKVVGVYPQGKRPVYEIELMDGRKTRADIEHIWSYTSREFNKYNIKTGTTRDLIDRLNSGKTVILPETDGVEYEKKNLPVHPYAIGALIGDGCLTCNGIQLSSSEEDIVSRVAKYMGAEYKKTKSNNYTWYIYADKKPIRELGMVCTARQKRIPSLYMTSNKEDRMMLLKGLFDTDGSVGKGNRLSISTASHGLKDDIVELCMSLGIKTGVSEDRREKYKDGGVCYSISIQTSEIVFESNKHKERYDFNAQKRYDNKRTYVKSIKYIGYEDCQCIKVDADDSLYITDDFIVTHNTTIICNMIKGLLSQNEKVAVWSGELSNRMLKIWLYSTIGGEKAIVYKNHPFRENEYCMSIKPEYEEKIDRLVDGKLFVYDGNKSSGFEMIKNFTHLHKRHGVKFFFSDNLSILDMTVKGLGQWEGESEFAKSVANFTRNNAVHLYLVAHPTKSSINSDPNFVDTKGRVKPLEKYTQQQVRGSATLVNLIHNVLFLSRAKDHEKAFFHQAISIDMERNGSTPEKRALLKAIEEEFSLLAYLVKNRENGTIYENALFGYDKKTRRVFGLSSKVEDLSVEVIKDSKDLQEETIEEIKYELEDF